MRRTVVLSLSLLLLLAVPATALAVLRTQGEGTLSVRKGDGFLIVDMMRGAAIGKIAEGRLTVDVLESQSCASLPVFGEDRAIASTRETRTGEVPTCLFRGDGFRFRFVGSDIRFTVRGEFSLSMVARARGTIRGEGGLDDGTYSIDGGDYVSLPNDAPRRFFLGSTATTP